MTCSSRWADGATVLTHPMAPWMPVARKNSRRRHRCRTSGNVTILPPPIAGYRIRHHAAGVTVEIKASHAPAVELARCATAEDAHTVLAEITADHMRPYLGEIGRAA